MKARALSLLTPLVFLAGCTHHQLDRSTVLATSTVMDIQYHIVLMNLAKLSCQPDALPSHADLADGVVQVNDRLGFGQAGGFTSFTGQYGFGLDQFGPSGYRQVSEQWGADATTDPQRLVDLQDLYRVALGLQPLPPPNAIAYLREQQSEAREKNTGTKSQKENGSAAAEEQSEMIHALASVGSGGGASKSPGGGGSGNSGSGSSGDSHRRVPIEILLTDVPPPGWFHVGCKKDVPKNACYVGCHGSLYAWVMPEGVAGLSRFTVTVLSVIKLRPGEGAKNGGLAVTAP